MVVFDLILLCLNMVLLGTFGIFKGTSSVRLVLMNVVLIKRSSILLYDLSPVKFISLSLFYIDCLC